MICEYMPKLSPLNRTSPKRKDVFTGIIEAVGKIKQIRRVGGDLRLYISTGQLDLGDVKLGDSIATNGVCLTVVDLPGDGFWADVSRETLAHTRLDSLKVGACVNLEKALTPQSRLGGHIVSGHVDGLGEVISRYDDARSIHIVVRAPADLAKYLAHKGSVCVDGISLTINQVEGQDFHLNIVPHTALETTINEWAVGTKLHLEVDVIARYLERLLLGEKAAENEEESGLTLSKLAQSGFLKP